MARVRDQLSFARLKEFYPLGHASDVKRLIGGKVDADWITNTCAIRMSRCLNYGGLKIPRGVGLSVVSGSDKLWYAYRVKELSRWLKTMLGTPDLSVPWAKQTTAPEPMIGKRGIMVIEANWSDATGHFTLWNETACVDDSWYFPAATRVIFWELPE